MMMMMMIIIKYFASILHLVIALRGKNPLRYLWEHERMCCMLTKIKLEALNENHNHKLYS